MGKFGFSSFLGAGVVALALSGQALAADMPVKAAPAPAAAPDFDVAFGGGIMSDYIVRGITNSNHGATATAYFEPHYKELYVGIAGTGIDWPTDATHNLVGASSEIDLYGGWRPTVGKWSFDLGYIYYLYPHGINPVNATYNADFYELYAKANYAITSALTVGGLVYYSPNLLNYGNQSDYWEANAKYVVPSTYFAAGWGGYVSGAYGYFHVASGDLAIPSYNTWNAGIGFTYKVFTLDLRYSDTDLNAGGCEAFWAVPGSTGVDNYCRGQFTAKLSFDVLASMLK